MPPWCWLSAAYRKGERRQDSCEPNKHEECVPSRICKTLENAEMTNRRQQNLKGATGLTWIDDRLAKESQHSPLHNRRVHIEVPCVIFADF